MLNDPALKLLFVCSRNRWRSPTAEAICHGVPGCQARSAGTEPAARVRVNEKLLGWADFVFCMEQRHVARLRERFGQNLAGKQIICLDVSDDYSFMEAELVEILTAALSEYVPALADKKPRKGRKTSA